MSIWNVVLTHKKNNVIELQELHSFIFKVWGSNVLKLDNDILILYPSLKIQIYLT